MIELRFQHLIGLLYKLTESVLLENQVYDICVENNRVPYWFYRVYR